MAFERQISREGQNLSNGGTSPALVIYRVHRLQDVVLRGLRCIFNFTRCNWSSCEIRSKIFVSLVFA